MSLSFLKSGVIHVLPMLIALMLMAPMQVSEAADPKAFLGEQIFKDQTLSSPEGQGCVSCHNPRHGFSDPDSLEPTSEGVIKGRFGSRNAPTILYAASSPDFHFDAQQALFIGGQFDDGRSTNLSAQPGQPFLSPLEMNNQNAAEVVAKVRKAAYADLFRRVYGAAALDDVEAAYVRITNALSAFESSRQLNPFNSRYDRYLEGRARFTPAERRGREIFERKDKGNCASCHPDLPENNGRDRPLFTDHSYDNLGIPRNPGNRFYEMPSPWNQKGRAFVDLGLGAVLGRADEYGKFKVPTLRNIAKTAPYMHNGYFKTLRGVIDFYNSRDSKPSCKDPMAPEAVALASGCWPAPEVTENVNHDELGNLRLTEQEMADLEAFLRTLSDP